jgi:hypothetical protein
MFAINLNLEKIKKYFYFVKGYFHDVSHTPKFLERFKSKFEIENNGKRIWGLLFNSQHFKGNKGMLELQNED